MQYLTGLCLTMNEFSLPFEKLCGHQIYDSQRVIDLSMLNSSLEPRYNPPDNYVIYLAALGSARLLYNTFFMKLRDHEVLRLLH